MKNKNGGATQWPIKEKEQKEKQLRGEQQEGEGDNPSLHLIIENALRKI